MFEEGRWVVENWGKSYNPEAALGVFLGGDGFYENDYLLFRLECLGRGENYNCGRYCLPIHILLLLRDVYLFDLPFREMCFMFRHPEGKLCFQHSQCFLTRLCT